MDKFCFSSSSTPITHMTDGEKENLRKVAEMLYLSEENFNNPFHT